MIWNAQLDQQQAKATGSGLHENVLPLLDLVGLLDEREGGQALHETRRRIARGDAVDELDRLTRARQRVLGERAAGCVGLWCGCSPGKQRFGFRRSRLGISTYSNFVADFVPVRRFVDTLADCDDFACALVSEDIRQRNLVDASALVPENPRGKQPRLL